MRPTHLYALVVTLVAGLLSACGGGGSAPPASPSTLPTSQPDASAAGARAESSTVYLGHRAPVVPPSAADFAAAARLAQDLAVAGVNQPDSGLVTPALARAAWRPLAAAAAGETAQQVAGAQPSDLASAASLALGASLNREVWVQTGYRLLPEYWAAIDRPAANWTLRDVDFARDGVPALGFESQLGSYALKLALRDQLQLQSPWPNPQVVDAVFSDDSGSRALIQAVRLTQGVRSLAQSDFSAQALSLGSFTVLKLVPTAETLTAFGPRRLASALKASSEALLGGAGGSATASGEMLLPLLDKAQQRSISRTAPTLVGVPLAFDPVLANFKGMDGVGGNFALASPVSAELNVTAAGLELMGVSSVGFAFNPANVNGGNHGGVFTTTFDPMPFACPSQAASLRSFYLAVFDANKVLQALVAVRSVRGDYYCV